MSLSLDGQIQCVKREIALRERVFYPGLVARNKLRQNAADYELAAMRDVLATLEGLRDAQRQTGTTQERR